MAQAVECLPGKCEALSSNPNRIYPYSWYNALYNKVPYWQEQNLVFGAFESLSYFQSYLFSGNFNAIVSTT
jgi:hypothetical protein